MTIGAVMMRVSKIVEEIVRILVMQVALAPAAYVLPRTWALAVADALSLLLLILPAPGLDVYYQMRQAYGNGRLRSLYLAHGWLALPLRDYVVLKRVLYKRENPLELNFIERNAAGVEALRKSGESYIVAIMHFSREAWLAVYLPRITHGRPTLVTLPAPERIRCLSDLRLRIQYGTTLKVFGFTGDFGVFDLVFVVSDAQAARTLYRRLGVAGHVVWIHLDAPWQKGRTGSYARPFAGHGRREFATGAARLAKLRRCPIVSCVALQERDGSIALEWGSPIRNVDNEIDVMNELIDTLEVAVGERPTQYILSVGGERRWNPQRRRWEEWPPKGEGNS